MSFLTILLGTVLLVLIAGTGLACVEAAAWVADESERLGFEQGGNWSALVVGNAVALMAGGIWLGPWVVPPVLLLFVGELWAFTRKRDGMVDDGERLLDEGVFALVRRLVADQPAGTGHRSLVARALRLMGFRTRLRSAAPSGQPKPAAAADTPRAAAMPAEPSAAAGRHGEAPAAEPAASPAVGGTIRTRLEVLGMRKAVLDQLRDTIGREYGMVLVAGPPGSGRTTTAYALLAEIDASAHSIVTIEDPIAYRVDGITQLAVEAAVGAGFAGLLRSGLRQDPDVLLVGDIRDHDTAEISCHAALLGRQVFAALEADDTVDAVVKLLRLGLEPMLVQTVSAVIALRLARRLCPACREEQPAPEDMLARLGVKPPVGARVYREKGCPRCEGTGFRGLIGLHELLVMTDEIRELVVAEPSLPDLRAAARRGRMQPLRVDGVYKALQGFTSIEEVARVTDA